MIKFTNFCTSSLICLKRSTVFSFDLSAKEFHKRINWKRTLFWKKNSPNISIHIDWSQQGQAINEIEHCWSKFLTRHSFEICTSSVPVRKIFSQINEFIIIVSGKTWSIVLEMEDHWEIIFNLFSTIRKTIESQIELFNELSNFSHFQLKKIVLSLFYSTKIRFLLNSLFSLIPKGLF